MSCSRSDGYVFPPQFPAGMLRTIFTSANAFFHSRRLMVRSLHSQKLQVVEFMLVNCSKALKTKRPKWDHDMTHLLVFELLGHSLRWRSLLICNPAIKVIVSPSTMLRRSDSTA